MKQEAQKNDGKNLKGKCDIPLLVTGDDKWTATGGLVARFRIWGLDEK